MMTRYDMGTGTEGKGRTNKTTVMATPRNGSPGGSRMLSPGRVLGLVMALSLVAMGLLSLPALADGTTPHEVCLGDAANVTHPDGLGTGCSTARIQTRVSCSGSGSSYECGLSGKLLVQVTGPQTCGSSDSSWHSQTAIACTNLDQIPEGGDGDEAAWELLRTYTASEIPDEGKPVVVPGEACVWADRTDVAEDAVYCESFNHTDTIPGDPTDSENAVERIENEALGLADYAVATAAHTEPPVGVQP